MCSTAAISLRERCIGATSDGESVSRRVNAVSAGSSLSAAALFMALAACGKARDATGLGEFPVRVNVVNNLIAPISISVDGVPIVGLQGGASSGVTVSSASKVLMWTSAKPVDTEGRLIADDIGEVKVAVATLGVVLEIGNVIENQVYITARIFNSTDVPAAIGVTDGVSMSCGVPLPRARNGISGYTQTGYYRLLPSTEIRAYRDPTQCSGPYTPWPASELRAFRPSSGLIFLTLNSPP